MTTKTDVAKVNTSVQTPSERFQTLVMKEFSGRTGGSLSLTPFQKRLIQNYFVSIDIALQGAEEKRLKKTGKFQDPVAITWQNVNLQSLAVNVVSCSRIGYDPALPNHINMIPFKNNTLGKYDIVFIPGYRGKELMAMKYGFRVPDDVIVEVVYSKDSFRSIKKDKDNDVETYEFKINDAFDRGEIVGGFYYHRYTDDPKRNKIVVFNMNEINKRKPKHASTEFWGGEKVIYENGEKTKKTEKVEGWLDQMVYKTLYRAAYGDITIDSQKIDDDFINLAESERTSHEIPDTETEVTTIINNNANKQELDIEEAQQVSETLITEDKKEPVKSEAKPGF